jgi:hypothetical protein
MAIPKTIEGREYTKFVDSPTRGDGFDAVETVIGNAEELAVLIQDAIGSGGEQISLADGDVSAVKAVYKTVLGAKLAEDNGAYIAAVVVGVSVSGAVSGNELTYKVVGRLRDSSLNFPINDQIYLGASGQLTNIAPTVGFRTVIGTSNGIGEIQLNIQEPIIL